jgi:hypothetical protein
VVQQDIIQGRFSKAVTTKSGSQAATVFKNETRKVRVYDCAVADALQHSLSKQHFALHELKLT